MNAADPSLDDNPANYPHDQQALIQWAEDVLCTIIACWVQHVKLPLWLGIVFLPNPLLLRLPPRLGRPWSIRLPFLLPQLSRLDRVLL